MKKITYLVAILLGIAVLFYLMLPRFLYSMVTEFEPFTFEKVYSDTSLIRHFGIKNHKTPKDYGYENSEDITFYSLLDSQKLSAWYVPAKKESDSTLFFIHGRTSNRLKTMKYLEMMRETQLDTLYNVFIADFRNSGESANQDLTIQKTYMGYKFAEDLAGGIEYLKKEKGQKKFTLYGFSMGAMTIFTYIGREDLKHDISSIDKIIVDSPLSNVPALIHDQSSSMHVPDAIFDEAIDLVNHDINGYFNKLTMADQLKDFDKPILVLQSKTDPTTPLKYTESELKKMKGKNIQTWIVEDAGHVKMYSKPKYHKEYIQRVNTFLRN
ncbi:alpha/beta hydrolase [Sediminitomix flava]|uniref:Pimeloyl-ACP methyl ester carboxylesterase n=1 Tax=Sediminitomix flava TaxID=379075 RepID=A0A315ZHJ1_SEDFL|nr:alpha/beta hydrolase [Sediminitomix flava]PWJ44174.1 pimeloyl-ACP methyl ester carboxylesterase [Sediminitomix flava]